MKIIKLTQDKVAIVDDEKFDFLCKYKWFAAKGGNNYYAATKVNGRKVYMHHIILGSRGGFHVDHINRDSLDNRRDNLRYATNSQNIANSKLRKDNSSGHKGVYKTKHAWLAQLRRSGKLIHLGSFKTKQEAVKARSAVE